MTTNLVIVESPGKVVTITKYLNGNPNLSSYGKFVVMASFGHIRDLAKKNLGIDIEHNFQPNYEFLPEKKDNLDKIKKAAKGTNVFLASDNDAEGEFISESLRVALDLEQNYKRIVFTEITKDALEYAIEHSGKIDQNQLEGQQTRRVLDRLVGFKLSPLLWKKFTSGSITLSAGRVQSAVMHLIIEREKEIDAFKTSPYWHFNGDFELDKTKLEEVKLYNKGTVYKIEDIKLVNKLFSGIQNDWSISNVKSRVSRQNPDAPFITSSLQQEASSKLRLGIKRIMAVAQELYEGGHITYMRTDSYNMSDTFKASAKDYILDKFGENYYEGGILKKKAIKGAQEAHECIRVTHVEKPELEGKYGPDHKSLYKLIWQRSVAFLMKPAVFDELDISIRDKGLPKDMAFETTFKKVNFNGYLIVYGVQNETNDFDKYMKALQSGKYKLSCNEIRSKNTWTSPPARYNDAGIVKLMETNGLGRPSTIATIIEKLFEKVYVIKSDIKGDEKDTLDFVFKPSTKTTKEVKGTAMVGAEQGKVKPTDIGMQIDSYLSENFDYIVNKDFTADMEKDLDLISDGKKKRVQVLQTFWTKFSKDLTEQSNKKEEKKLIESEKKEIKIAGKTYTVRIGPFGPLAEYEKDGKKAYIGLKGYLAMVKKEYLDIDTEDIEFLLSLPMKVGSYDKKDVLLLNGPYGFYLKHNNNNVKIPKFAIKDFVETKTFTNDQLKSFIEYAANKPANTKSANAAKANSAKPNTAKPKQVTKKSKAKTN